MAGPDPSSRHTLEQILEEFERANERRPTGDEELELAQRGDWLADFELVRERVVRAGFEELAWDVEQRGHHAWIEDLPASADSQGVSGIEFNVLPVADQRTARQAPGLQLLPDAAHRRVIAQVHDVDLEAPEHHVVALADLDQIDEAAVRTLGTRLIDIVFLRRARVLQRPADTDPGDWAPEDGGVVPHHGQSSDWLG